MGPTELGNAAVTFRRAQLAVALGDTFPELRDPMLDNGTDSAAILLLLDAIGLANIRREGNDDGSRPT